MTSYTLALLPGDGIGRDVMDEAKKILRSVEMLSPLSLTLNEIPCGGKHYLRQVKSGHREVLSFAEMKPMRFYLEPLAGQEPLQKMGILRVAQLFWV